MDPVVWARAGRYGANSQNVITGIALPGGSAYSFAYEGTPGRVGNGLGVGSMVRQFDMFSVTSNNAVNMPPNC